MERDREETNNLNERISQFLNEVEFNYPLHVKKLTNMLNASTPDFKPVKMKTVSRFLQINTDKYRVVNPQEVGSNKFKLNVWIRRTQSDSLEVSPVLVRS